MLAQMINKRAYGVRNARDIWEPANVVNSIVKVKVKGITYDKLGVRVFPFSSFYAFIMLIINAASLILCDRLSLYHNPRSKA